MSNSFFVFLPSNVPDYSSNKPNKFRVHLPKPLYFNGNWVCGLHSISYPYSWPSTIGTLDEQWLKIHFTDDLGQKYVLRVPIPGASHTKVEKLSDFLNYTLKQQINAIDHVFDPDRSSKDVIVSPPRLEKRKRDVLESPPRHKQTKTDVPKSNEKNPILKSENVISQSSSPAKISDGKKEVNKTGGQKVTIPSSPPKISNTRQTLNEENKNPVKTVQTKNIAQSAPLVQNNQEKKIEKSEKVISQGNKQADVQNEKIKTNEKGQTKGEKVILTPKSLEQNVAQPNSSSNKEKDIERIEKTYIPPAITPLFALGLPEFEKEKNKTIIKEEDELEFSIEKEQEANNNYKDSSKFLLWRGGIRLRGNLTLLKNIIDSIKFEYNIDFARFRLLFTHENIDHISLSPQLGYVLGFENTMSIQNEEIAKYGCDLRGGFSSFAVYSNGLTENMIIGNSLSSLLRVVSVSGAMPGEYNEKIYDTPIYARVLPREINEIEIELRTLDNGRLVPFAYGTVLIVLIFKKVINF
ncbi:hypothetical protein ACQ4LE_009721 [Meloidogyne hapla]